MEKAREPVVAGLLAALIPPPTFQSCPVLAHCPALESEVMQYSELSKAEGSKTGANWVV